MLDPIAIAPIEPLSEEEFAKLVDDLTLDSTGRELLVDLLREDHACYNQRSAAAIVRMRGWVLLAFARVGISDRELSFVLEEFDVGTDAYLVAAAAKALRSYTRPTPALAAYAMRALINVRNEPLSFESYGAYATSSTNTTPHRELLGVLTWLGPHARSALPELENLLAQPGGFPKSLRAELTKIAAAIREGNCSDEHEADECCKLPDFLSQKWWKCGQRRDTAPLQSVLFEDQDGVLVPFREIFHSKPSIVVFFYTRCDNPWKCSRTVSKLAQLQQLLRENGLSDQIRTAAITYDPLFDVPERMRDYGQDRGVQFDAQNRMLRATEGFAVLCAQFRLGVNFVESVVNRHRIELLVLDGEGRIAASFERLHWNEFQVLDRARNVLLENTAKQPGVDASVVAGRQVGTGFAGLSAVFALAFLPKCPMCWAAYLSVLGTARTMRLDPSSLQPMLMLMMLANVLSVGLRARATRRKGAFYMVFAGALMIGVAHVLAGWNSVGLVGFVLTLSGTLASVFDITNVELFPHRRPAPSKNLEA